MNEHLPFRTSEASPILPMYPCWVGIFLCVLMPGAAHFFSGRKLQGVVLFLGVHGLLLGTYVSLSIPGYAWLIVSLSLTIFFIIYCITLLIFSYRPVYCFSWLCFLLFVLLLNILLYISFALFKTYCVEAYSNRGTAMSPTLIAPSESDPAIQWADWIIVNKWVYRNHEPNRGDIVLFQTDGIDETGLPVVFFKRVVGLPGEILDIASPYVLINGERLVTPPIFEALSSKQENLTGYFRVENLGKPFGQVTSLPITLGPDEYFLLGDNSTLSFDSRFWGPVSREKILGKAIRIYFPFSRIRELK